ncbi:hypothetical protein TWF506_002327 [Arthrobotrys conoides]|uniref:Clr5 domain-containing protein n=1 Tax=Arthrobotrys conoides TaxID=74498 RepID=A0AAN8RJP9_9PEZI
MPQSVLEGRIVKRGQSSRNQPQVSTQLTIKPKAEKNRRAKFNEELASNKHKEAIKYYYLTRRYPLKKLHEAMEIIFKVGATPKQYSGYVNNCNFRKKLSNEEWRSVTAHCYAAHALGQEVAIKLNEQYIIEPQTIRKELPRKIPLSLHNEIQRQQVAVPPNPQWPLRVGHLELCIPTVETNVQKMPHSVWSRLPFWESQSSLLQICQQTCQRYNYTGMEIGRLANSNYFKYLKTLLYRLSNNLIDFNVLNDLLNKVYSLGFRTSLKELLSLKTHSARAAAENILPLLILRYDKNLIRHICGVHHNLLRSDTFYKTMFQLLTLRSVRGQHGGHPLHESRHSAFGLKTGKSIKNLSCKRAGRAFAIILQLQPIPPSTLWEAAILLTSAVDWGLISLTAMKLMLPSCFIWEDVESEYDYIFGECVLDSSQTNIPRRDLLSHGFQRDIHMITLKAVLLSDYEKASDLLPFTKIKDLAIPCMRNAENFNESRGGDCLAETLGLKVFSQFVSATAKEQHNQNPLYLDRTTPLSIRDWELEIFCCSLNVASRRQDQRLCTFIFKCLQGFRIASLPGSPAFESSGKELEDNSSDDSSNQAGSQIRLSDTELKEILTGTLVEALGISDRLLHRKIDLRRRFMWRYFGSFVPSHVGGLSEQYCRKLVEYGANIDSSVPFTVLGFAREKSTILNYAITSKDIDLVKTLLRLGADPNHEDQKGRTSIIILLIWLTLYQSGEIDIMKDLKFTKEEFGEVLHELLGAGAIFPTNYTQIPWGGRTSKPAHSKVYFSFQDMEDLFPPEVITSLRAGDTGQINGFWDGEHERPQPISPHPHVYTYKPCERCEHVIETFDQAFGETGEWRGFGFITKLCWNTKDPDFGAVLTPDQVFQSIRKRQSLVWTINGYISRCIFEYYNKLSIIRCLLLLGDEVELLERFILNHPIDAKEEISTRFYENTVLGLAAMKGRAKCLRLLLQNGCNPKENTSALWYDRWFTVRPKSFSALNFAIREGNLEIGKSLLEYGADLFKLSGTYDPKTFESPVELAVELRRIDFIALFLVHSIECRDVALAAAEKYGHRSIANWIKDEWMPKPSDSTNHPGSSSVYEIEE